MSGHRPFAELAAPIYADPERRRRVEACVAAMKTILDLVERRVASGHSRAEIERALETAHECDMSQASASDAYLSTLGSYVKALGGHLEINAVFPDETVTLRVPGAEDRPVPTSSVRSA
ncbi:MAG TPA: hypothetical protein VFQ80_10140 [Thermomicrobiales bacterium]|nr:hypothetical protein [Thermomicrobiales bacterium]